MKKENTSFDNITTPEIFEKRRLILCATGGLALLYSGLYPKTSAYGESISFATAINRSGRMRALSQRMSKAYTQMALGILPEKASEIIISSQAVIQRNIRELQALNGSQELNQTLSSLDVEMKKMNESLSTNPLKNNALNISNLSDNVLAGAERSTKMFEALAKSSGAKIVNLAGRQRMLSQRAAKYYMLIQAGFDSKPVRAEMDKSRGEFTAALEVLTNAPISTPSIRQDLELAKQQWGAFQVSLGMAPNPTMLRNVATTSERLLEVMDSLTNQYDQALKDSV